MIRTSVRNAQRGFSLIELLVAFAVLAMSLGVIMQIYARSSATVFLGDGYAQAARVAESRLQGLGIDYPLEAGVSVSGDELGLAWTLSVEPFSEMLGEELLSVPLLLATVTVSIPTGDGDRWLRLQTLRLAETR